MAFYAPPTQSFVLAPEGQFQAVCCELLDHGINVRDFKNKDTGDVDHVTQHEVQYVFQINKLDEEGNRYEVRSQIFSLKLSDKASLRKFLTSARGHDLLPEEKVAPGVDISALIGRNFQIQIVHNKVGDKTYANIPTIMPIMEGMPLIEPLNYTSKQPFIDAKRANNPANNVPGGQGAAATAPAYSGPQNVQPTNPQEVPF